MQKISPMMEQYLKIKEKHKDHIVFFRLGDFYEMFFDDAKLASKELELTLTGRDCGQEERAPMCGIPYHSCDGYIQRLIQKGYKVAICEQTEDPSQAKGIVKRDVVRVITPGTLIESQMLDEGQNNFICSVFEGKYYGVTFADISTGEVYITQVSKENGINSLLDELAGFMPKEVIISQSLENSKELINFFKNKLSCVYSYADETIITKELIEKNVFKRFKNPSNNEKLKSSFSAVCSLCILINYIENMQMGSLELFDYLNFYNESNYMQLGITARMNLEISQTIRTKEKKGTLLWVIDKTKTSMGKRFLKREIERPLLNKTLIENRLDATDIFLKNNILLNETGENLSGIYDIERLLSRIVYGSVNAREIKSLEYTAEKIPVLKKLIENYNTPFLKEIYDDLDSLDDIKALIKSAICENPPISVKDGNIFNKGYNKEIDELRDVLENGKFYLAELEAKEKEKTGIKNLKVSYNKVFGYYFEVTKSYLEMVPDYFIRKQTLVNNERFVTEELKDLETKILNANDKITRLEYELFSKLRLLITENLFRIEKTAKAIAKMDFIYSLAKVASENNYSKPEICEENLLIIKDGRHPVVEKFNKKQLFVANDANLDGDENQLLIITGPNMAGKSTYMRQIALIVIMAQIGSFVPASYAKIGICDKIFTRIGASDDLSAGQSTFMVEMSELANILENATPNSLVILDEIGRGTSTFDGMSIAKSVIEYITGENGVNCKTLFATHYHELTEIEKMDSKVKNYNIAVKKRGDEITFLRRIVKGAADDSYGIEVAKLAGVPELVVQRAKIILKEIEKETLNIQKNNYHEQSVEQPYETNDNEKEIIENLKTIDFTTITPIEALNILYNINQKLK